MDKPRVVIGIDTETDVGSFTPFYSGLENGLPLLLELFGKKSVPATFFFVAEAAQKFPALTREVMKRGFEVGCHTIHHETIGDPLFDIPLVKPVLPEEVPNRLRRATSMISEVIGSSPVSFRAPRLWGSTTMVNSLEELGYVADATYPMYYFEERIAPYHPSATDWTQEGDLKILEIPNFADLSLPRKDPWGRNRDQWPIFRTAGADVLISHIDNFIALATSRNVTPVLCFYFHPWEFIEMPSRFDFGEASVEPSPFIIRNCGFYALQELGRLIDLLRGRDAEFYSAAGMAAYWSQR
ncbi:MAG TPA: polysaccharide deacetylase family protein [Atribacteraceae bacterium]|nr:polysaccharide deacetylase family protein [Atribacteraceae bacterium]